MADIVLGALFIGSGAVASAMTTYSTLNNDFTKVCSNLEESRTNYNNVVNAYENLITNQTNNMNNITSYIEATGNHRATSMALLTEAKKQFSIQQIAQYTSLSIFVFILVLGLLFKYFNVFGNIWDYFTK